MSKTQTGSVISNNGHKFVAVFHIGDIQYTASGSINPGLVAFKTPIATLHYDHVGQLTGTRSFTGRIGVSTFDANFNDGCKIEGELESHISPSRALEGVVFWTTD